MDIKVEQKGERIAPENLQKFGKDEIERVKKDLEDATKRLVDLQHSRIMTREKATKIAELNYAIAVGKIYLQKLKNKWA